MAITIDCECGKRLQAKDEFAGKRFKCPGCGTIQMIPPLVEAYSASPLKVSGSWEAGNEDSEENPVPVVRPAPRRGKSYLADDDADEDRTVPKRKKKARSSYDTLEKPVVPNRGGSFFSTNGGMVAGLVMMLAAVAWFFGGLLAGYIFFYPPVLFIIGIVAFIKGLSN